MPTARTATKKTTQTTAKKPAQKKAEKVTMDELWGIIKDIGIAHKELEQAHKRSEAAMEETRKAQTRTEAAMEETQKTLNKAIGGLSKTVGNITENMLIPSLVEKFRKLGFTFQIMSPHRKIYNDDNSIHVEIDAFLENSKQAMAVEVKTTCKHDDVDYHIERMEKIRRHADSHNDNRQFAGAIAATVMDEDTRRYALENGFYLIEPSGEDFKIVKPECEKLWSFR
jgi:hypothetical protein